MHERRTFTHTDEVIHLLSVEYYLPSRPTMLSENESTRTSKPKFNVDSTLVAGFTPCTERNQENEFLHFIKLGHNFVKGIASMMNLPKTKP
jgi:hypothetical protein